MRNLRLEIEYDGTGYCGWQVQSLHKNSKPSIQATIEESLRKILQEKVKLIASGRTDAGVHALGQIANFKTSASISSGKLQKALNGLLPDDISIRNIEEVDLDFHSRFSAKSKVYRYTILNQPYPSALLRNTSYFCSYPLKVKLMQQEAKCLVDRHDFAAFCASGSGVKDTVRIIKRIQIIRKKPLITIEVEANGFLYNMARNIAGTLIEVGRGRFQKGSLKKILLSKNRKLAGPTALAKGLCLIEVRYK